jgi:hypothetical protein
MNVRKSGQIWGKIVGLFKPALLFHKVFTSPQVVSGMKNRYHISMKLISNWLRKEAVERSEFLRQIIITAMLFLMSRTSALLAEAP